MQIRYLMNCAIDMDLSQFLCAQYLEGLKLGNRLPKMTPTLMYLKPLLPKQAYKAVVEQDARFAVKDIAISSGIFQKARCKGLHVRKICVRVSSNLLTGDKTTGSYLVMRI